MTDSTDTKYLEIWRLMRFVARLMFRVREGELEPYRISVRQAAMLSGIKTLGTDATVAGIARHQVRDPSTVSNIIIRMERLGLVKRLVDLKNRRRVHVVMTRMGEDLYEKTQEQAAIKRVISGLSAEQCDRLIENLKALRRSCHQELDAGPGRATGRPPG